MELARVLGDEAPSQSYLARLLVEREWDRRAAEFDDEAERIRNAEERAEKRRMKAEHRHVARLLLDKGVKALETIEPAALGPQEARQFIETGQKLERQSYDEPDTIVENRQELSAEAKKALIDNLREALGSVYRSAEDV